MRPSHVSSVPMCHHPNTAKKNRRFDSTAPLSADSCEILFSITSHEPVRCKIIYQRFGDKT